MSVKKTWLVCKGGSSCDDVIVNKVVGTKDQIKRYLLSLINIDIKEETTEDFGTGTEKLSEIIERSDGRLYCYAIFDTYHNDYVAIPENVVNKNVIVLGKPTNDPRKFINLKWRRYCSRYSTDTLYFYDGTSLVTIAEGDGSNLDNEDRMNRYVDYWSADVYTKDQGNCGGGLLLLREYIKVTNRPLKEIINFIRENVDAFDNIDSSIFDHLIDVEKGKKLEEEFQSLEMKKNFEAFKNFMGE